MSATLTEFVRHDQSDLATAVRKALSEQHIDAESSVIADFCPESASLADGAPFERHHLVVVDRHRHAFVGMLHRTANSAHFDQWRVVPSDPIDGRDATIRALNENRRAR